jgi:putative glutamine amidotransferase
MNLVGITQRVDIIPAYNERRDALDQRWYKFLAQCDITPVILPNCVDTARRILANVTTSGMILSGGNSSVQHGGNAPERDLLETFLINYCIAESLPLIGVCRGMQVLQVHFGHHLRKIDGHVCASLPITTVDKTRIVNSYHTLGAYTCPPPFEAYAHSDDKVVKAIKHAELPLQGIMWHPERYREFAPEDIQLFRDTYRR